MKLRGKPSRWVLLVLCVLSLLLMLLGERSRWLCRRARPVLVPLSHVGMVAAVHLRTQLGRLTGAGSDSEQARIAALSNELLAMQALIDDLNQQLQEMRAWRPPFRRPLPDPNRPGAAPTGYRCKLIDAVVIGSEALPLRNRRLLGTGAESGVTGGEWVTTRRTLHEFSKALPRGLTALGRNYVVGKVTESAAYSATLQLVTDPGWQAQARILRLVRPGQTRQVDERHADGSVAPRLVRHSGRSRGPELAGPVVAVTAEGDGHRIVCRHVPAHHDVREDDVLTTAWSAGLPFRLTIGRVEQVEREAGAPHFVTVKVRPEADLGNLRRVYIVLPVAARGE